MYRIRKILNHNTILVIKMDDNKEYLLMGKGAGFSKKVGERIEKRSEDTVYSLQKLTDRGEAREIIKSVSPVCLELANDVLNEAEREFGKIDRAILFPMADHIEYAVRRIKNHEQISNPLTEDIRVLFYKEYKVAQCMIPLLQGRMKVEIDEHEVGYIALHIHSAINDEKVSQAMMITRAVRECITLVEEQTSRKIDVMSLAYNRLMNHVRYMVARALNNERLKLNMNDYMEVKFPEAFRTAAMICDEVGRSLKCQLDEVEIGYLAMHIERVVNDEM
ncbi:PRD domain-containing protein [Faecalicatena orotica]|uniref:BglG family transcriptional antiterminator n=1 Tax=Faecalicatena orotica TaxID=1544 RepID=A0A2Y9BEX2_9FIRM|nr:PRD domain-containing protein [Faecalicatena orotica]PWJ28697.1 BglG family transcriptional antiterminator [Faecalicatena orotica]SSA56519.1 transcriptional antiterminator, BglG family [Faecalicatena orotica]